MTSLNGAFQNINGTIGFQQELKNLTPSSFVPEQHIRGPIIEKDTEKDTEESVENGAENGAEEGMSTDPISLIKSMGGQIYRNMFEIIIGLISFILIIIYVWKKDIFWYKKIALILLPIMVTHFYLKMKYTPVPRYNYFLSVLGANKPIITGVKHQRSDGKWPFPGSAVLNHGNNNLIFIGGGINQNDSLLLYNNGKFIDIIQRTNLNSPQATYSAVSFDMDKNGFDDLIIGRDDGVYLYKNHCNLRFEKIKIMDVKDTVPVSLSISDYNKDGNPDIYVSNFMPMTKYRGSMFNDPTHMRENTLLRNESSGGNFKFVDVTAETNSGGKFNTFTSAFVDLNNDTWPDLVLANDSGEIEILENHKDNHFTTSIPFNQKGNWMGLGIGDIDNDMDQDLFLTNVGSDVPRDKLSLGDIKPGQKQAFSHVLLRNDGNFKFVDITKESGISGTGFGWGAVMADLNNDKNTDLLFAENTFLYAKDWLYPGPGHYYEGNGNKFNRKFKYKNYNFGQTPLLADLNQDNIKDVVWINMNGPSQAYINKNLEGHNFINVKLPETSEFVNAKIVLDTGKRKYYREIIQGGHGFGSDQSNIVNFGLGKLMKVKEIRIYTNNGKYYQVSNPRINSTLVMRQS